MAFLDEQGLQHLVDKINVRSSKTLPDNAPDGTIIIDPDEDIEIFNVNNTSIDIDSELSLTSTNPVQNKIVTTELATKAVKTDIKFYVGAMPDDAPDGSVLLDPNEITVLDINKIGTVQSVNGIKPDSNNNVSIDTGVKTINSVSPNSDGDIILHGFLQRNTAYKVGDIAYTTQLPAGYYLECVTAGTTGNTEPTFKVGGVTLDGTAEWNVQQSASVASVEDIYIKAGDVINIPTVLYINGTLTGAGKSLNFTIPLIRPIKAERATLIAGQFLFRQNGNYYCGNATETSNILDMGSCSLFICQSGLAVTITLNEAKGAQNNATVALSLKNIKLRFS